MERNKKKQQNHVTKQNETNEMNKNEGTKRNDGTKGTQRDETTRNATEHEMTTAQSSCLIFSHFSSIMFSKLNAISALRRFRLTWGRQQPGN